MFSHQNFVIFTYLRMFLLRYTYSYTYVYQCIGDIDGLNILCHEVSQALGSERALLRTTQGPSDWHRRMDRREECWEGSRESMFEYVVINEALLETNV